MHTFRLAIIWLISFLLSSAAFSQSANRIRYNNQDLFISGANLAWVSFANDIGPGSTDTTRIADVMLSMHDNGGNALRWWLHTNGTVTPQFDASGYVIGPGTGTIDDIKKVLDIAWQREIGVDLCLWSFDMLRSSNSSTVRARNANMLNDTSYTNTYIRNCLIPMVQALKGHPAVLTWEIFNEPEGMSVEFGWSDIDHVAMSSIQRFINLCAAAIHRTDSTAKVTSGAWSFYALTDNPLAKAVPQLSKLSKAQRQQIGEFLQRKYRSSLTPEQIVGDLERIESIAIPYQQNYYRDDRLIAAGGDSAGILDFYSVHYYSSSTPISTSPFNNTADSWNLNKPIVVGEFAMESGYGSPTGIPKTSLYDTLYQLGYAGALAWSFTDIQISSVADMLAGMQSMWDNHQSDVDILGIGGVWPLVTITSPTNNATFSDTTAITIIATASDSDGMVDSVEFFYADTMKIGTAIDSPYTVIWHNVPSGTYNLKAIATDNDGHRRASNIVRINVGTLTMTRMEAETAGKGGGGVADISVGSDPNASNGQYQDIHTNTAGTYIEWTFYAVGGPGNFKINFGYRLQYGNPKDQFVNVNGSRVDTITFDGTSSTTWYETGTSVDLVKGLNKIQMEVFWGWMYVDYLSVESRAFTNVENHPDIPQIFSLEQNYPNPFNPSTTIMYSLPVSGHVKLKVYDILGKQVAALIDKEQNRGSYEIPFDASFLPSGVYFYRLSSNKFTQTRKMIILK